MPTITPSTRGKSIPGHAIDVAASLPIPPEAIMRTEVRVAICSMTEMLGPRRSAVLAGCRCRLCALTPASASHSTASSGPPAVPISAQPSTAYVPFLESMAHDQGSLSSPAKRDQPFGILKSSQYRLSPLPLPRSCTNERSTNCGCHPDFNRYFEPGS